MESLSWWSRLVIFGYHGIKGIFVLESKRTASFLYVPRTIIIAICLSTAVFQHLLISTIYPSWTVYHCPCKFPGEQSHRTLPLHYNFNKAESLFIQASQPPFHQYFMTACLKDINIYCSTSGRVFTH